MVIRALSTALARRAGFRPSDAEAGLVIFIQRHGTALNLYFHLHILALDGVYTFDGERPRFHRVASPAAEKLERSSTRSCVASRARWWPLSASCLPRQSYSLYSTHGALVAQEYDDEEQLWLDLDRDGEDALTQLQSASIRYRIAVGPIAGRKTLRLHTPRAARESAQQPKPFTAERDGFSLSAAVTCRAGDRRKLERLCRYVARPAIALDRLSRDGDGLVVYELKHSFRDGTTHVLFEPLELMAHIPVRHPSGDLRSSISAVLPIGHCPSGRTGAAPANPSGAISWLFAPNARHHRLVVPAPAHDDAEVTGARTRAAMTWAQRLRRVIAIDISRCPRGGAPLRVLAAAITEGDRGHPGPPRVARRTLPAADVALTVSGAHL